MQADFDFTASLLPLKYQALYENLVGVLIPISSTNPTEIISAAQQNLTNLRDVLLNLKRLALSEPFESEEEEIVFFKIVKPVFYGLFNYWTGIFDLELLRPMGGKKVEEKYLKKQLARIKLYFEQYSDLYQYFRSGLSHLDHAYFLRSSSLLRDPRVNEDLDLADDYATRHDRNFGQIKGYELLQKYILSAQMLLKVKPAYHDTPAPKGLQWTASKAGLVELIFALHSSGVYNNGNADLKSIASYFERTFDVKLGNFYHVFNEIRLRKKNRTQLLDNLKQMVIRKMDDLDER